MKNVVKRLREKPIRQRRQILYISTTAVMLVIFGVWITTIPYQYKEDFPKSSTENSSTPFDTIREDFSKIGNELSESWANVSESFSSLDDAFSQQIELEQGDPGFVSTSTSSSTLKIIPLGTDPVVENTATTTF